MKKLVLPIFRTILPVIAICLVAGSASSQVINVNFIGRSSADPFSPNYVGVGPVGTGTYFNPVYVDSPSGAVEVEALGLLDMNSVGTPVNLRVYPVSGGQYGASSSTPSTDILSLNGTGLFNSDGPANFILSGLTATVMDLYIYGRFDGAIMPVLQLNGSPEPLTPSTFTAVGPYTSTWVAYYQNVSVTNGEIAGVFGNSGGQIWTGLTVSAVPEPSTVILLLAAGLFGAIMIRRKKVCAHS